MKKELKEFKEELDLFGRLCKSGKEKYAECQRDRLIETFKEDFERKLKVVK